MSRPFGSPNKATTEARMVVANFVDKNAPRMQKWLDEVAKKSPERALNYMIQLLEYHVPKLARTEITGTGGGPVVIQAHEGDAKL